MKKEITQKIRKTAIIFAWILVWEIFAKWIGNVAPYYLQPYVNSEHILSPEGLFSFSEKELEEILSEVKLYCPSAALRK